MKKIKMNVIEDPEKPVEKNILASSIVNISSAITKLQNSGITFKAIVILTQHNCKPTHKFGPKPGITQVRAVLESVAELEQRFCK